MAKTRFNSGDTVRVVGEPGTSRIRALLPAINGALLETEIGGYRNWNVDELRLVKRADSKNKISESSLARIKAAGFARERKTKQRKDLSNATPEGSSTSQGAS